MKGPFDLVKNAVDMVRSDPKLILGVVAVPFVLDLINVLLDPTRKMGPVNETHLMVSAVFTVLLFVFANTVVTVALLLALDGRVVRTVESYRKCLGFLPRFLPLALIWYGAAAVILMPFFVPGLLLIAWVIFAIPAIMLLVWMVFSELILVLENTGLIEAGKQGWKLLSNSWWPLFARLLFLLFAVWVLFIVAEALFRALGVSLLGREILSAVLFYPTYTLMITYLYLLCKDTKKKSMVSTL